MTVAALPEPTPPRNPETGTGRGAGPSSTARLHRMARAFAFLFLEVEAGVRARRQLQRLMCPQLYARVSEVWVRPDRAPGRVARVAGTRTAPGRFDVVVTVERGGRTTALAFRLRRTSAGWRVDDLVRPEDGPLPEPSFPLPVDEPDVFDLVLT